MCALFINDLDAGAGRMGGTTQYTVNNQMVNATLMNIADNPTNVQLPGVYKEETIPRVPVICTGNDFSTLYAPLIRDGRMEKYYWNPTREDRVGVCMGIFHVSMSGAGAGGTRPPAQAANHAGGKRSPRAQLACPPTRPVCPSCPTHPNRCCCCPPLCPAGRRRGPR